MPETYVACSWNARCSPPPCFETCWGQMCCEEGAVLHRAGGDSRPQSRCWSCLRCWMMRNCGNLRSCLHCSSDPWHVLQPWVLQKGTEHTLTYTMTIQPFDTEVGAKFGWSLLHSINKTVFCGNHFWCFFNVTSLNIIHGGWRRHLLFGGRAFRAGLNLVSTARLHLLTKSVCLLLQAGLNLTASLRPEKKTTSYLTTKLILLYKVSLLPTWSSWPQCYCWASPDGTLLCHG